MWSHLDDGGIFQRGLALEYHGEDGKDAFAGVASAAAAV